MKLIPSLFSSCFCLIDPEIGADCVELVQISRCLFTILADDGSGFGFRNVLFRFVFPALHGGHSKETATASVFRGVHGVTAECTGSILR